MGEESVELASSSAWLQAHVSTKESNTCRRAAEACRGPAMAGLAVRPLPSPWDRVCHTRADVTEQTRSLHQVPEALPAGPQHI